MSSLKKIIFLLSLFITCSTFAELYCSFKLENLDRCTKEERQWDEERQLNMINYHFGILRGLEIMHKFDAFIKTVGENDKQSLAKMVRYPITVHFFDDENPNSYYKSRHLEINNEEQFIKNYDQIITPKVREEILARELLSLNTITRNGIMLWSDHIKIEVNIKYENDETTQKSPNYKIAIDAIKRYDFVLPQKINNEFCDENEDDDRYYGSFFLGKKYCSDVYVYNWDYDCQRALLDHNFGMKRGEELIAKFHEFTEAIRKQDKPALAKMMIYPLEIDVCENHELRESGNCQSVSAKNEEEFIKNYNQIITVQVEQEILLQNNIMETNVLKNGLNFWTPHFSSKIYIYCDDRKEEVKTCKKYHFGFDRMFRSINPSY